MPRVHVIIPAYNCEDYLESALDSIAQQTFSDFVVSVVDDCSTDRTAEIVEEYADDRVRLVRNANNQGLPGSVNGQLHAIDSEFIARMDGDDLAMPGRFEAQLAFLEKNADVDILGTSAVRISPKGEVIGTFTQAVYPLVHDEIKTSLLFGAPLLHPSVFLRRQSFVDYGPIYRTIAVPAADYDAWVSLAMAGFRFANLPEQLMQYRVHGGQISKAKGDQQKRIGDALRYQVLKQIVPELTSEYWNIHDAIRTRRWKLLTFDAVRFWFQYLRDSNLVSKWSTDEAMRNVLTRRFEHLIRSHKHWSWMRKGSYLRELQGLFQ